MSCTADLLHKRRSLDRTGPAVKADGPNRSLQKNTSNSCKCSYCSSVRTYSSRLKSTFVHEAEAIQILEGTSNPNPLAPHAALIQTNPKLPYSYSLTLPSPPRSLPPPPNHLLNPLPPSLSCCIHFGFFKPSPRFLTQSGRSLDSNVFRTRSEKSWKK